MSVRKKVDYLITVGGLLVVSGVWGGFGWPFAAIALGALLITIGVIGMKNAN